MPQTDAGQLGNPLMPEIASGLCACSTLRRAARSATQLYDLVLQPTGLKATQFIALRTIAKAGELPQWRFAREQALAVETLSRRLAVLRKRGLVSVKIGGNHGERIYSLTEQGKQLLARAAPYWERAQQRLAHTLGAPELQLLLRLCDDAVAAAQEAEHLRASNGLAVPARANGSAGNEGSRSIGY
jgi:DNA-binding MarR family transcriptional regulator